MSLVPPRWVFPASLAWLLVAAGVRAETEPAIASSSRPQNDDRATASGATTPVDSAGPAEAPLDPDAAATTTPPPAIELDLERDKEARAEWTSTTSARALPKRAEVLTLTVSGGVSLGSHEAGQIYLLAEALRSSPDAARLLVASGASAGNANALIGVTEACLPPNPRPEQSIAYRVWVNVGFADLFREERVTSRSIFVQDALNEHFNLLKQAWQHGLPESCEFVVGLSATRLHGIDVELAEGVTVPRQQSRVVIRVSGRDGAAPVFSNYLDPASSYKRTLLPLTNGLDPTAERDIEALRPAVLASAAFPVAFEPVPVPHCTTPTRTDESRKTLHGKELLECRAATRIDEFIDGGVFDNNPLGITAKVAEDGLVEGPHGPTFRDLPTGGPEPKPTSVYGYIDPDIRSYPIYEPTKAEERRTKSHPLTGIIASMGGEILSSSRSQELASVAERSPEVLDRMWIVKGNYPPTSELLGAFFGFFERDFREFDFHLGTYDTFRALRAETADLLGVESYVEALDRQLHGPADEVPDERQELACMLAHYEPENYAQLAPSCEKTNWNFRALLQLSLLRLWSNCQRINESQANETSHLACKKAYGGFPPPRVDQRFGEVKRLLQHRRENDFDYALRALAALHFHYRDLGLEPNQADRARLRIRRVLEDAVRHLADAQPSFAERTLILTAGRAVVNKIDYEPPQRRVYALLGSALAVGYLHRMGELRAWHYNADARLYNVHELLTGNPAALAGALTLGFEYALLPLSGSIVQTSFGARFGYQLSAADSIGFDPCEEDQVEGDSRRCSQILVQAPFNVTLLERVRLSFSPRFYPVRESFGHDVFDFEIGLGAEFF